MKRYPILYIFVFSEILLSCSSKGQEIFVTANTNLCPNCYYQYQMLNDIDNGISLHLVFHQNNHKEAKKFADKFFNIKRDFDILCDDSLYLNLSHNTFPWLYYYQNETLVFDAELNQYEQWMPIINQLKERKTIGRAINQLLDEISLSENSRCIPFKDSYLFMDFTFNELHLLDSDFNFLKTQDFASADFPKLYQGIFGEEKIWKDVSRYATEIAPYIPDFGKIKIDNACVYNDTLFLLINVNYTETYFNERRNDSAVRVLNESAIVGIDEQLNIQTIYPLRFRDSLQFEGFMVNAFPHCAFQINDWDNIILGISQKEKNEKHILCRMRKSDGEIMFKSLIDNAFIPKFNEKHNLGTTLCLIKIDDHNAYFNVAPVITNYESGQQIDLPFSNENARFDLKNGIAETDYILSDIIQTSTGDYILFHYLQSKSKLSLIDGSGSLIWTIHLPNEYNNMYLVDEKPHYSLMRCIGLLTCVECRLNKRC